MSSPKSKKLDPVVTESVLNTRFTLMESKLMKYFQEFSVDLIKGIQVMFDEQDRRNEKKFVLRTEFQEFKDQNLIMLDGIMSEIKAMREEMTTFGYRQAKHTDQLDDHETRITTVESHLRLAS
ncbi:MAG TPA: hypothetical protein VF209_03190 [Patescibacteria group bacterium]